MKIALFGGTGRTGSQFASMADASGHELKMLIRSPEKADSLPASAEQIHGDALDQAKMRKTLQGADMVVSALGTDKQDVLSNFTPLLLKEMNDLSITHLITVGTAGILQSRTEPHLYRFESPESKRRSTTAAEDHQAAYEYIKETSYCWTVVCPTFLPDGENTASWRYETDYLPEDGTRISTGNTADFLMHVLENHSQFCQKRIGVCE